MLLRIDFPKEEIQEQFDQIHVDIQGVKVDDPTEFIRISYGNSITGEVSSPYLLPVTDIENYANKEDEPKVEQEVEPIKLIKADITNIKEKNNAGQSPLKRNNN